MPTCGSQRSSILVFSKSSSFKKLLSKKLKMIKNAQSKTAYWMRYEENVNNINKYQAAIQLTMIKSRNHESFNMNINQDRKIKYAFIQVLRYIRKQSSKNINFILMWFEWLYLWMILLLLHVFFPTFEDFSSLKGINL